MKLLGRVCYLLLSACGEPLTALVGVISSDAGPLPEEDAASAPELDAASLHDATMPESGAPDATPLGACLDFPDVVPLVFTGSAVSMSGKVTASFQSGLGCTALGGDAGAEVVNYFYRRTDGAPLLRADRPYALFWPPDDRTGAAGVQNGKLAGSAAVCAQSEPLTSIAFGIGGKGCAQLSPKLDAQVLSLTAQVVGLVLEFKLCEGSCPPP